MCCLWIQGIDASRSPVPGWILADSPWWEQRPSAAPGGEKGGSSLMDDRVCAKLQAWAQLIESWQPVGLLPTSAPSQGKERLQVLWWKGDRIDMCPSTNLAVGITYFIYVYTCTSTCRHYFSVHNELSFYSPVVLLSPCNYELINTSIHPILPSAWWTSCCNNEMSTT